MKVMQVIPMFGVAGAEVMCKTLALELNKNNIEVIIVSLYSYYSNLTNEIDSAGVKCYYLDKKRGMDYTVIKKLKKIIEAEKPDVIHNHLYSLKYVVWANKKTKINVIHTVHNIAKKEAGYVDRILYKQFFKKKNVIPVALSKNIQESIHEEYKLPFAEIPIIFNGIDLTKCIEKTNYNIKDKFSIVHIGRFMYQKNHVGLINAYVEFHKIRPDSELILVGDGELKEQIVELTKKKQIYENVKFEGIKDNVYPILNQSDVFILPSLYEGMPMTLIEAMATGIPIIATRVGGVGDMLNENNALLINCNENEIVDALLRLIDDCELRKNIGENARKDSNLFSSKKMMIEYLKLYKQNSGRGIV